MSNEPSKISGYTNEVIGAVKENVGWVLGDKQLEAAGRATRTKGELEVDAAVTQEKIAPSEPSVVAGYAHQATGVVKENLGWALGKEQLELEGKATRELGAQEIEAAQTIKHNEPSEPSKLSELTQEAKIKAQQATGTVKEYAASAQEKVQPYTEQAKEAVKPIADKAAALTTQAKETVKEYAASAQEKVQPYTEQAKEAVKPIADKAAALTAQAQGAVKENVGWAVGNKELEASGKAIREKGKFDADAAHAEQRATGKKVQGNIVFLDEAKTFPAQQPITTSQQQSNF